MRNFIVFFFTGIMLGGCAATIPAPVHFELVGEVPPKFIVICEDCHYGFQYSMSQRVEQDLLKAGMRIGIKPGVKEVITSQSGGQVEVSEEPGSGSGSIVTDSKTEHFMALDGFNADYVCYSNYESHGVARIRVQDVKKGEIVAIMIYKPNFELNKLVAQLENLGIVKILPSKETSTNHTD